MIIGIVGFGSGALIGFWFGSNKEKKRHQEDLAEVKDFYLQKLDELGVMAKDFTPEEMIDQILEDDEEAYRETEEYFDKASKYASSVPTGPIDKGRPIIKYNKPPLEVVKYGHIDPEEPDEGEGDDENDEEDDPDYDYEAELEARAEEFAQRRHENQSNGKPYVIEFDEFDDAPEGYTKEVLYYYSKDRVLCEDDDSMIEDEEGVVGLDYEDVLEMQTNAWVRNDALLMMYEIRRIDDSYHESVANVVETPREREYRILGRRKQGIDL